ncbi:MAG: SHOCT domain-containing protein [Rhodobacteraceae bacterium]|nr:SHOCT domain-containing protein [Paracoccaceae bacterium]MCC0068178.1 SHOCT domain-containing protein [Rhodovulum sp.]HRX73142.1 SHOCT domain-containing protein [Hyphomonas sp.]
MFRSRSGRPSLIGRAAQTAARTAVISATATAVSSKVAARQATAPQPAAPIAAATANPVAASAAPAAGGLSDGDIARLQKLAELHGAGVLTAEEFAEQKARILA